MAVLFSEFSTTGTHVLRATFPITRVISMGRRNTCLQFTCGSFKTQGLSRALI